MLGAKSQGRFSVHSCYEWMRRERPVAVGAAQKWKEIWSFKFPLKVKAFTWLVYLHRILTKEYRAKWVPDLDKTCIMCGSASESIEHLFILCPMARRVWDWLQLATGLDVNFQSLEEMWEAGRRLCTPGDKSVKAKISQSFVPAVVWSIWISRNMALFRACPPYAENIWEEVGHLIFSAHHQPNPKYIKTLSNPRNPKSLTPLTPLTVNHPLPPGRPALAFFLAVIFLFVQTFDIDDPKEDLLYRASVWKNCRNSHMQRYNVKMIREILDSLCPEQVLMS
ncbi:hypothetical protein QJS10_CPA08g01101 [Acorus calamus]|uniref:Reverse transcriptase zinc-binding domain-containing protein n=1 Tax=Acorus calamus TaxID=4465 RepID=A0AAV9EDH5_ACOCL|nr:hypothetical protein QJS10_CPA08g01101 [Acorus calamus]